MTKRELTRLLERKWSEALDAAEKEYNAAVNQEKQNLCCDLGFDKVAAGMQEHIEKAQKMWDGFVSKCEEVESISFRHSYLNPTNQLYEYSGKKGKIFQRLLNSEIQVETDSMLKARDAYNDLSENISKNYKNVIATVQSLKTAKEAAEYLTALGFDLSELETKPAQVTALAVQIDTSYLFVKNAA